MDKSANYILRILCLQLLLASGIHSYSQNLVPNPSFEDHDLCPNTFGGIMFATPWLNGNNGSADYYHACAVATTVGVPENFAGWQYAHTGDGYAGAVFVYDGPASYREYIMAELNEPLAVGMPYEVEFWVSLANLYPCGSAEFGAYFSVNPPPLPNPGYNSVLNVVPQVSPDLGFVSDTQNWVLISGCFIAQGGEQYITIGNFTPVGTPIDPMCNSQFGISYYYIDDVSVILGPVVDALDIELGDSVAVCDEYLIDVPIPNVNFYWSNGSQDSTLLVTTTGMYSVTIVSGCARGIDSLMVTIHGSEFLDLGPDEVSICEGDTYTVSLDPIGNEYQWEDGSTSSEYVITNPGLYQATLDDGCHVSVDEILVNVVSPPEVFSLGEDQYLCPNDQVEFDFDATLGDFMWQDNSTSSYISITYAGHYALTISNECGFATDDMEVFSLLPPSFDLGPDTIYLCGTESLMIDLDENMGYFNWQDGSHANTYTIQGTGHYSLSVTNDCGSFSDTVYALTTNPPYVSFGNDTIICGIDSFELVPPEITGEYVWQDSSNLHSLSITQSGTYSLMVTNACGVSADTIRITFEDAITIPNLGPDLNLCTGQTVTLNPEVIGAHYLWQDGSTADSLLITTSGTYFVKVYNVCESFSDTVQVIVNSNPPQLDLPASIPLCQGSSTVLAPNISGVAYLWNDASQNDSLLISTPGIYNLTVSNACGTDTDTVIVIDNGPLPSVSLGNDISICPGDQFNIHPQFSDIDTWLWQDGSTDTMYSVTSNEIISVIASNACGVVYDTLIATLLPATSPITLGNDTSLCSGQSFVLTISTPNVNILWSDGTSNNTITVDLPGQVFATIYNVCGENADTILVSSLPDIPELNLGIDQSLCPGEVILLSPFIPNVSYLWNDGTIDTFLNATQQGIISLTISNSCGSSTDSITISESTQGPQVYLGPDILECQGDVVNLMSDISGVNFLWQDGSILSSFSTSSSGMFILNVSNNCGTDADTVEVDIHGIAPQTNLGVDTTLCEGKTLTLTSSSDSETTIEWQNGSTSPTFVVNSPGMYSISESNHCGSNTDTIKIDFLNVPAPFSLGPDTSLCPGESLILIAPLTTDELAWQDGSDLPMIIADKAQTYSLIISNECGTVSDNLTLSFDTRNPVVQLDPKINLCPGDVLELDVTQLFPATYSWSTGQTVPIIQLNSPGDVAVTVATPCALSTGETEIVVDDSCFTKKSFYIPNVFSPNGDGINDLFTIQWNSDLDVQSLQLAIFDRWGNLVYTSDELSASWNGKFKEDPLNPGVYVYQLELHFIDQGINRVLSQSGDVTLVH